MPRRARLVVPGIPWHIIQRGNNRTACFFDRIDYSCYLDITSEQAGKYDCHLHAWRLMTNHVHLLVTPEWKNSAAMLMKHLRQHYVHYINRSYQRTGTLWEGRFRSCLVQETGYILACYRYIEMNPVRAEIVQHPAEYHWTSYRANGQVEWIHWTSPHPVYLAPGGDSESRTANSGDCFRKTSIAR